MSTGNSESDEKSAGEFDAAEMGARCRKGKTEATSGSFYRAGKSGVGL